MRNRPTLGPIFCARRQSRRRGGERGRPRPLSLPLSGGVLRWNHRRVNLNKRERTNRRKKRVRRGQSLTKQFPSLILGWTPWVGSCSAWCQMYNWLSGSIRTSNSNLYHWEPFCWYSSWILNLEYPEPGGCPFIRPYPPHACTKRLWAREACSTDWARERGTEGEGPMTQTTTTTTDTPINADDARSNQEGEGERESSNGGIPNIRKYLCPNAVAYLNHLLSSTAFLILNSKPLLKGKTNGFFILCPTNELARVVCNHHSEFLRIWYFILPVWWINIIFIIIFYPLYFLFPAGWKDSYLV